VSETAGEFTRVRRAFSQPTLTLLHQRQAPVVITVFRQAFGRDNRPIPTARLHAQVEGYLGEIRRAGEGDVPAGAGRDLCHRWMRGQWLVRSLDDSGQEVYSLTSHAQQALELVKSLSRERATLSEHRIATILGTVRRFNAEANPDRAARVTILNEEIARLTLERDRLVDGEELAPATDDYMEEGFTELLSLVSALPSDFARVEERFGEIRSEILAAFRAEERPPGDVIDAYLARADALMTATPEGRAFEGAFALLRDDALVSQLREDLTALLDHPAADRILGEGERTELRGTVRLVRDGLVRVLTQRSRVTAALKDYIVAHDAVRDRELEQALRSIESELMTWVARTGPRAVVELPLLPPRAFVDHLRERFHDPADDRLPEPLAAGPATSADPVSLRDLVVQGGPRIGALREQLEAARGKPEPASSLGEVFADLPEDLRRPVEILGLLQLAAQEQLAADRDVEIYRTRRPDGSERAFAVPRVPLPDVEHIDPSADPGEATA